MRILRFRTATEFGDARGTIMVTVNSARGVEERTALTLVRSTIADCSMTSAGGTGEGGALFIGGGTVVLENGTSLRGNTASSAQGGTLVLAAGSAAYALPAPDGHWIVGRVCSALRRAAHGALPTPCTFPSVHD